MMVMSDGNLWGWGWNVHVPGISERAFYHNPIHILDDVVYVAAFGTIPQSTIVIRADNSVWSWGDNSFGQLGDGSNRNRSRPVSIMDNVTALAIGEFHALALMKNGNLFAWGDNIYGQLGNGTTTSVNRPTQVVDSIVSVATSHSHSMAITLNGDLLTWGDNRQGQLGNGTTTSSSTPIKIKSDVVAIAAGNGHSLAVTGDGRLWAWGSNANGQLGNGATMGSYYPIWVMDGIAAVFAEEQYSMVITLKGKLYAWGDNNYGQLGNGTYENKTVPGHIKDDVVTVALSGGRVMAITSDNNVYSWGKYMVGHYYYEGIQMLSKLTPGVIFDADGFVPSSMYMLGRWRLSQPIEYDEAFGTYAFVNYIFFADGTGLISEVEFENDAQHLINQTSFTWEILRNREIRIILENGTAMLASTNIHYFQNSQFRQDLLVIENENIRKVLRRLFAGQLFD